MRSLFYTKDMKSEHQRTLYIDLLPGTPIGLACLQVADGNSLERGSGGLAVVKFRAAVYRNTATA
jgi:hypothetical protein